MGNITRWFAARPWGWILIWGYLLAFPFRIVAGGLILENPYASFLLYLASDILFIGLAVPFIAALIIRWRVRKTMPEEVTTIVNSE